MKSPMQKLSLDSRSPCNTRSKKRVKDDNASQVRIGSRKNTEELCRVRHVTAFSLADRHVWYVSMHRFCGLAGALAVGTINRRSLLPND